MSKYLKIIKRNSLNFIKTDFHELKLENYEVEQLILARKNKYQNVINSGSYIEFELLEKITSWESTYYNELRIHKQILDNQKQDYEKLLESKEQIIKEISSSNSWKLTKPPQKLGKIIEEFKIDY